MFLLLFFLPSKMYQLSLNMTTCGTCCVFSEELLWPLECVLIGVTCLFVPHNKLLAAHKLTQPLGLVGAVMQTNVNKLIKL